jgi:hypothetical protein
MDGKQVRHLASGALLAGSLVSGGTVGNVLLLGSAEHESDPVGRLSAQLVAQAPAASARGAGALATHPVLDARGARAVVSVVVTARIATVKRPVAPAPPPAPPAPVKPAKNSSETGPKPGSGTRVKASQGSRAAEPRAVATRPATPSGSGGGETRPAVSPPKAEKVEKPEKPEDHRATANPEHPLDD